MSVISVDFSRGRLAEKKMTSPERLSLTFDLVDPISDTCLDIFVPLNLDADDTTVDEILLCIIEASEDILDRGAQMIIDGNRSGDRSYEEVRESLSVQDFYVGLPGTGRRCNEFLVTGISINGVETTPSCKLLLGRDALEAELHARADAVEEQGVLLGHDIEAAFRMMLQVTCETVEPFSSRRDLAVNS